MGMTIDKSILYMSLYKQRLEESISDGLEEDIGAYNVAITSMRKYQKIKEQVDKENFAISDARLIQIREIINGNDDN